MDSKRMLKTGNSSNSRKRIAHVMVLTLLEIAITDSFLIDQQCDDVSVIGAGIGGSYLAWRLRDRNLSVKVYEYSDRVGGRLHTVRFQNIPDINIELGAMRFIPEIHPLMNATAHALGLTVVDFKLGLGVDNDTYMYTRGQHFKRMDVTNKGPYNLKQNEKEFDEYHLRWSLFKNGTDYSTSRYRNNETLVLYVKTKDDLFLYQQSVKLAYTTMGLSSEAYSLLRDVLGFHSFMGDTTASLIIPVGDPAKSKRQMSVKTIAEGMEQIPQTLIEEFLKSSTSHGLVKDHRLQKLSKRPDGHFQLEFTKHGMSGVSVCAKKVVLAVPRLALKSIEWDGLKSTYIADILDNASKDAPAAKLFLAYNTPWWRNLKLGTRHTISDLPNRQTYDFGTSRYSNRSVLLAVYTDMEDVKFWQELQQFGKIYINCSVNGHACVSNKTVKYAHKFLSEIYNISVHDIPEPVDGAISLWNSYPYGAAWHVWKPGYIWENVENKMTQPIPQDDVFISSGLFSFGEADAWAESALNSVEMVLKRLL